VILFSNRVVRYKFTSNIIRYLPVFRKLKAFTLIELLIGISILGVILAITVPVYNEYKTKLNNAKAVRDIINIQVAIESFNQANDVYPNSLAAVNMNLLLDPWGAAYTYLNLDGVPIGEMRKDQALVPINSDYDLYSKGPDGLSLKPLTAAPSRDDIVRANNGSFIGIAADY